MNTLFGDSHSVDLDVGECYCYFLRTSEILFHINEEGCENPLECNERQQRQISRLIRFHGGTMWTKEALALCLVFIAGLLQFRIWHELLDSSGDSFFSFDQSDMNLLSQNVPTLSGNQLWTQISNCNSFFNQKIVLILFPLNKKPFLIKALLAL